MISGNNSVGNKRQRLSERAERLASIQVQEVVKYPLPGCDQPSDFSFSTNGSVLCSLYSKVGTLQRSVHACTIRTSASGATGGVAVESGMQESSAPEESTPTAGFEVMLEPPRGSGVDEKHLSLEEKLRRERLRERGLGITRYFWSKSPATPPPSHRIANNMAEKTGGRVPYIPYVMVPLPDGVYLQWVDVKGEDVTQGSWSALSGLYKVIPATTENPILEPTISPDGQKISYVSHGNLFCYWVTTEKTVQLTHDASKGVVNGLAEYVAQEEMDRRTGHWWNPNSTKIAFTQCDTRHIPLYRIQHLGAEDSGPGLEEEHEYPFVGESNAKVRLGILSVEDEALMKQHQMQTNDSPKSPSEEEEEKKALVWTDVCAGGDSGAASCSGTSQGGDEEYVPRVGWFPDGRLYAQLQDRKQQKLKLVQFDPDSGKRKVLLTEITDVWHNLSNCFRPLCKLYDGKNTHLNGGFIWASEKDGYRHLYLHSRDGTCVCALTSGNWMVDSLEGVDETRGLLYFTGTADSEIERHLYCLSISEWLSGGSLKAHRRVTIAKGMHHVVLDPTFQYFVDIHDSPDNPPQITFCSLLDGKVICMIHKSKISESDDRLQRLSAQPPELVTITANDGTVFHGAVYKPDPEVYGKGPYRTLVSVYGGPHVQTVSRSWILTVDMRAQLFRAKGFLVFKLDNRGSSRRGLKFEGAIQHKMGGIEIEDQVLGVKWLVKNNLADPNRVGMYGWSYGGYMSAMALAKAPDVFKVAVAGAPVTSWDGYDTHYTERYMGLLEENKDAYASDTSVVFNAFRIKGKLLLIHGMIDENVHFRHTVRLVRALNSASIE